MFLLRLLAVVAILAIGGAVLYYIVSGDKRGLRWAWMVTRVALWVALFTLSLFFLERVLPL